MKLESLAFVAALVAIAPAPGHAGSLSVVHRFPGSQADGVDPRGALLQFGNLLYGTTYSGGTADLGTVYSIDATGAEKVVFSFTDQAGGAHPYGGLTSVGNMIYGVTVNGGEAAGGFGTVFSMTPSGVKKVLHAFTTANAATQGAAPIGPLTNINGTLYGITRQGGVNGCGVVYSLSTSGAFSVLHSFTGASFDQQNPFHRDGCAPNPGLVNVGGVLYGTTYGGGDYGVSLGGTTFSLPLAGGPVNILYSFGTPSGAVPDGYAPVSGLTAMNGVLYGLTGFGGIQGAATGSQGRGTVYGFNPATNQLTTIHAFAGGTDPASARPIPRSIRWSGSAARSTA